MASNLVDVSRWIRLSFALVVMVGTAPAITAQRVTASAADASSLGTRRVTLQVDNVPLVAAITAIAQRAGLSPFYDEKIIPAHHRVTLHVSDVPVTEALQQALRGTGLEAHVQETGYVAIVRGALDVRTSGTITGTVIDSKTKRPIQGATVALDDATHGAMTENDGTFRVPNVSVGTHRVTVRMLGYVRQGKTITVGDGEATTATFALDVSTNTLEQVVVTGTVIQTELKAVPSAITVITAKQIEERGITKIDQLFRGDVPGLFAMNLGSGSSLDEVTMFSRGATAMSSVSAGTSLGTNPVKTYVDGVELADPKYLSQIDLRSIERIEILTGPQASTIYGSNAINGVMQIFTKRGTSNTPQLTLNLLSGWVENNFRNTRTPQHDYGTQLSGIEGRLSYNAGGSWNYVGPWTPAKQTTRTSGFGGTRLELPTSLGRVTADVIFRRSITRNRQRGNTQQTLTNYQETGWWNSIANAGLSAPTTATLVGQTVGLTLGYVPVDWWSHEFGLGQDASDTETEITARGYTQRSDTTLSFSQNRADRRSLHYTTTVRVPITFLSQATVTVGTDAWQNLTSSLNVSPQTLTGTLTGATNISRRPDHNRGSFLQTQFGVNDRLFLTYGLRVEWNPDFGAEAQPNYAPRYGVAYTQDIGPFTAKLRGSYGRSTRPPQPQRKDGQTAMDAGYGFLVSDYGNFMYIFANPHLAPEHQQGGEGGLELYVGTRSSLVITRYNQVVDGLINGPKVDSVRSLLPNPVGGSFAPLDPNGYGYAYEFQYLNIGSIRNQGWELQESVNMGPLTTRGTYSWTKSRVLGIAPAYRTLYSPRNYPQYQPGATFQYLPEHTWALGVTYAQAQTTVTLNVTGTGLAANQQDDFFLRSLSTNIRLPQNRQNVTPGATYISHINGYTLGDITAAYRFSPWGESVLQIQNLTNHYANDFIGWYPTIGRQSKLGFRMRLR